MFDKNKPMLLGDIFSVSFNLIKETIGRNIIIAIVFIVPAGFFMVYGFHTLISVIYNSSKPIAHNVIYHTSRENTMSIFEGIVIFYLSLSIYGLGYLAASIGITKVAGAAMEGKRITLGETFRKIFSITYIRSVGQIIVIILITAVFITCGIIMISVAGIFSQPVFKLIAVLMFIAAIIYLIYLFFSWYFAFVGIVCEDKRVFESFSKSFWLVKGNWWRTVGIILLVGILIQFAISIISTPLSFLFMWNFTSKYLTMSASGFNNTNPSAAMEMLKSFGFGFGLVMVLSVILNSLIAPLFKVVMYFDLRIRKHEFVEEPVEPGEFSFE
jgi:hypothetical protein